MTITKETLMADIAECDKQAAAWTGRAAHARDMLAFLETPEPVKPADAAKKKGASASP